MVQAARGTPAGERTRARVLEEAIPLFAQHGFAGTSVRMVANAAQVNVATLAYHFSDKAGLYQASVDQVYASIQALEFDPSTLDPDKDLAHQLISVLWAFSCARRDSIRLLHRHVLDTGRVHDRSLSRWLDPLLDRVRPIVPPINANTSEHEFRRMVMTVTHVLVRMAIEDREQARQLLAIEGDYDEAVVAWLSDLLKLHLHAMAASVT